MGITFSPVNIWFLPFLSFGFCDCTTVAPWKLETNGTSVNHAQSQQPWSFSYCRTTCDFAGLGVLLIGQNACFTAELCLERWELWNRNVMVCKSDHVWGRMCISSRNPLFPSACWVAASLQAVSHVQGIKWNVGSWMDNHTFESSGNIPGHWPTFSRPAGLCLALGHRQGQIRL